jgi:hypothetical protein
MSDTPQTGAVKDIWIHLMESAIQLTALQISRDLGRQHKAVARAVLIMANNGFLSKVRDQHRRNGVAYRVDRDCKVPQNVTVQEIRAAMGLEPTATTKAENEEATNDNHRSAA